MKAVLWKELKDSRCVTLGLVALFLLFLCLDNHQREIGRLVMRVLLLPVAVGYLGARFMGAESDDERIHLLTLPLPFPGFFGLRLVTSVMQAVILVTAWLLVDAGTRDYGIMSWETTGAFVALYSFLFALSGWISLWSGNIPAACSMSFLGSALFYYMIALLARRPFHLRGTEMITVCFGTLAVTFFVMMGLVARQDGLDSGPRIRLFRLGLVTQLVIFAGILMASHSLFP